MPRETVTSPLRNDALKQLFNPQGGFPNLPFQSTFSGSLTNSENSQVKPVNQSKVQHQPSQNLWQRICRRFRQSDETEEPHADTGSYFDESTNDDNHDVSAVQNRQSTESTDIQEYPERRDIMDPENFARILKNMLTLIMVVLVLYIVITLHQDITNKMAHETQLVYSGMKGCEKDYYENKCQLDTPKPERVMKHCIEQEECMKKDPTKTVQTIKIIMGILGDAVNEFVNRLSGKATVVLLVCFFILSKYGISRPVQRVRPAPDFRRTPEYTGFHSRLNQLERLNSQ